MQTIFVFYLLLAAASRQVFADCLNGGLVFEKLTSCTYEALLAAYTKTFSNPYLNCPDGVTAEQDLWAKLGPVATVAEAKAYVKSSICSQAYNSRSYVPFTQAAKKGTDNSFEKLYFDGKSIWNEQVETNYGPSGTGVASYNLQIDAASVSNFFNTIAKTEQVEFPSTLTNFQNCTSNVAYCCFVTDRQANDNNGNCQSPYDSQCVDKDPGDNTDLCYVDHSRGSASTKVNSNGENVFSKDDDNNSDNAEGPMHCHGIAWGNDPFDYTSRYKGNNKFFVSMFDHFNQRGYVRAVPGAPMCACAEQMPVVSRADCTEVVPTETYKIFYTGQSWGASLTSISLTFTACNGYNGQNNNLEAYAQRLYYEKKINSTQMAQLSKSIVGNNNCIFAASAHLRSKGYTPGYQESSSDTGMVQIVGKGLLLMDGNSADMSRGNMCDLSFSDLYRNSSTGILLRICQDCDPAQQKIYVRFNPGFSPNGPKSSAPFLYWLKGYSFDNATVMGEYNVAWAMYSTYSDALARVNPWPCVYNWNTFFPGDCDPIQGTKTNQFSRFETYYDGRTHAAWFIDTANSFVPVDQRTFGGTKNFSSVDFEMNQNNHPVRGGFDMLSNGTVYARGAGYDIWGTYDYCHFISHQVSGLNATLTTRIRSFGNYPKGNTWARVCLMIRKSLNPRSASFEMCLTSGNDFVAQWRPTDSASKTGSFVRWDGLSNVTSGYVSVKKNGDYFSAFYSADGITWTQRGSTQFLAGLVGGNYYAGIAINSQSDWLAEAVIDNYKYE